MRVIPVLDVMGGAVVRAVAGRRSEYRPVRSRLTTSTEPTEVAAALLSATGATELYVADLDAIVHRRPVSEAVAAIVATVPATVLLDAGGASLSGARRVMPFETGEPPAPAGIGDVFSLDLRDDRLVGDWKNWGLADDRDAVGLAAAAWRLGFRTLIVLDVGRVGLGEGTGTEATCTAIRAVLPAVELIAGGGVRGREDLKRLSDAGADAVLVASALHDGRL